MSDCGDDDDDEKPSSSTASMGDGDLELGLFCCSFHCSYGYLSFLAMKHRGILKLVCLFGWCQGVVVVFVVDDVVVDV